MSTTFHSCLCFSANNNLKIPYSSTQEHFNSLQQTNLLTPKPKTLLQKTPLINHQPTQHSNNNNNNNNDNNNNDNNNDNVSIQFKEKIMCLEIMGVDSEKALSQNPNLHTASLHSIHTIINFLQSKGIHQKDLGRIFGMCPTILTSDIDSELNPVFSFLSNYLKVHENNNFRRVINKCPRLLVSSVKHQLKPALFYLESLGFRDYYALAYQDPILLVSSVEKTLVPKLDYLVSLGFSRNDAVIMALRCPGLFTFSIENNFKPKFEYFSQEMKGKLEDLKEFPQYFAFSLEKRIKPRHIEVVEHGVSVPLPLLLKTTVEEFRELIRPRKWTK